MTISPMLKNQKRRKSLVWNGCTLTHPGGYEPNDLPADAVIARGNCYLGTMNTGRLGKTLLRFHLRDFEGPLDLLLFLIRESELDIWDIPIADITAQYQRWMDQIGTIDLEQAGDYILMSATLIQIKARMLLPRDPEAEEAHEDPRQELVRKLLEYQQYRELSQELEQLEARGRQRWRRRFHDLDWVDPHVRDAGIGEVSLFDLAVAWFDLSSRPERPRHHEVELFPLTVEEQAARLATTSAERQVFSLFKAGDSPMDKPEMVVSFLAMLDLVRRQEVHARQIHSAEQIWIFHPQRMEQCLRDLRDLA